MTRGHGRRAAVGAGLLLVAMITACGGPVAVDVPDLDAEGATACEAFADSLPDTLAEQSRVDIEPPDAPAAAYGDPAIVVTCGVAEPPGFGPGASCEIADRARWYIPAEQYGDEPREITLTAAWSRPRVEVVIPDDYWPDATAAVMAQLAPLVRELRTVGGECL